MKVTALASSVCSLQYLKVQVLMYIATPFKIDMYIQVRLYGRLD